MAGTSEQRDTYPGNAVDLSLEHPDSIVYRELAEIIPVIASVMARQAYAGSCSFYVYDLDSSRTIAVFRHGESQLFFPQLSDADSIPPTDIPAEAEILRTRQSIRRSKPEDFDRWPMVNDVLRSQSPDYADVVVPLVRHQRVYGVVYLWRYGGAGAFTEGEVLAIERLASVGAMAVEFARQYASEHNRRHRLNALLNVASLASSHLTVDDVMPEVTSIIRSATDSDVCNLYVFDAPGESVIASFSSGLNERELWVFEASDEYPVADVPAENRARSTLKPVVVRDPEQDFARGSELAMYSREAGISEILVVPIVYQSVMIGVVYIWYRNGSRTYGEEVSSTAQGLANQAGSVIHQARLYDATRQHISETEALRRIGDAILSGESLDATLDQIAEVLNQMIPYDYALVGRVDQANDEIVIQRIWGQLPESLLSYRLAISSSLMGETVRTGEILSLQDAFSHPAMHRYEPVTLPIKSVLIAPLITEGRATGVLYLARADAAGYSNRQVQLMELLSQRAALAIERTRARESLSIHAARQTFLAEVTNKLIAAQDPEDVLQEIAEMACRVLADGVGIALSSWRYGEIRWVGGAHADCRLHEAFHGALVDQQVVTNPDRVEEMLASSESSLMQLHRGNPTDGRKLHDTVVDLLEHVGARHLLNVPMQQSGRAAGLIALVTKDEEHEFDDELREIAQIVANRIGDALERRQVARNRESLLRVSEAVNTHADLDDLLELFASELRHIIPYDELYINRLDEFGYGTVPLKFENPFGLEADHVAITPGDGICGEVIRTRKAVLDNDAHLRYSTAYETELESDFYRRNGQSAIVAPLIAENEVIGTLFLGRTGANRFSESDFETFLLFTGLAASAIHRTELLHSNQRMYRASVEVLAAVVDAKDPTTLEHSRKVARYSRIIAEELMLGPSEVERIELAALLHDIGKLSIPDHVLSKPGPLNPQERALINTHPDRGASILNQHPALMNLVPLVRHHHERIDGAGYPDGLGGDDIPLGASIISVADAFDTMTSERTYQRRKTISAAFDELKSCAGTQFNERVVDLFLQAVRRKPGSRPGETELEIHRVREAF
jgi:putative nucleotidyltransferase with HDIG domain